MKRLGGWVRTGQRRISNRIRTWRQWSGFFDYREPGPDGAFHRGKTVWDWMQLLIIPLAVLLAGYLLENRRDARDLKLADGRATTEASVTRDRTQQAALETYLLKMADLLLANGLRVSTADSEVRDVAQAQTLATLRSLDGARRGSLMQFLADSDLITGTMPVVSLDSIVPQPAGLGVLKLCGAGTPPIIPLYDADLREADLTRVATLRGANLRNAQLTGAKLGDRDLACADLSRAQLDPLQVAPGEFVPAQLAEVTLTEAQLVNTTLTGAHLDQAILVHADLRSADLRGADLTGADLRWAWLGGAKFEGAILQGADLRGADLAYALKLTPGQLASTASYYGARNLGDLRPDWRPTPSPQW